MVKRKGVVKSRRSDSRLVARLIRILSRSRTETLVRGSGSLHHESGATHQSVLEVRTTERSIATTLEAVYFLPFITKN